ncbi:conserved hypothetical protein [Vibrio nigripulchritudo SO65]|uniref:hypothetical protein n=1 Tax=Vibrio nigripulchritudo TaxID=28173 RepID=UPI0003B205C9|nr:hypothetical protein [Vibrio nigripulchritudo]CCN35329.1 conserved hypothetical protein [Vibrio nigripulchritudo AM115]CCN40271.1 conserved hypothetical protein [Vibrio nigripulchritudo FTn2]CCN66725.1 conserved hypothetical protein [Vibrio nigripulchritudo POn4]CCN78891.1 conserved hypothetical protein [Vibrio nigripulchritudo SO65]
MKNLSLAIIVMSFLAACGGGGGGGDASSGNASSPAPSELPAASPAIKTSDLVAPDGFDYSPIENRSMSVDISATSVARAYLSVYRNYHTLDDGTLLPDYGSRIVAMPLKDGKADITLIVSDSSNDLLGEIWFYDGSQPLQQKFYASQSSWSW